MREQELEFLREILADLMRCKTRIELLLSEPGEPVTLDCGEPASNRDKIRHTLRDAGTMSIDEIVAGSGLTKTQVASQITQLNDIVRVGRGIYELSDLGPTQQNKHRTHPKYASATAVADYRVAVERKLRDIIIEHGPRTFDEITFEVQKSDGLVLSILKRGRFKQTAGGRWKNVAP